MTKQLSVLLTLSLLLAACGQTQQTSTTQPPPPPDGVPVTDQDDYWAKENFDLQRAGDLFADADSPEEFEELLNQPDNVNNLDLNGDGWVDYVSVREFDDRDPNTRGLSLFSSFGPGMVQEIAQMFLFRDGPDYPGARFLVRGNDQIYGPNQFYEANWLDRALPFATSLFGDHQPYQSPYYFDHYPSGYNTYQVVETPVYRTRVVDLYPRPALAYATAAPTYWDKIKIKSPNNGLHLGQIKARLANPTKEQAEFFKNNPRQHFAKGDDKPGRDNPPRSDRGEERGNPSKGERGAERGNPGKPDHDQGGGNPNRGEGKGGGNPDKGGGQGKGGGNPDKGGGQGKGGGGGQGKGGGKKP